MQIKFYDKMEDSLLKFAVIIAKMDGKNVFCKHRERSTYEIPGGHREDGESILDAAKRELYEETGAVKYDIKPVCIYSVACSMLRLKSWKKSSTVRLRELCSLMRCRKS